MGASHLGWEVGKNPLGIAKIPPRLRGGLDCTADSREGPLLDVRIHDLMRRRVLRACLISAGPIGRGAERHLGIRAC
jgi:hypothetical protein